MTYKNNRRRPSIHKRNVLTKNGRRDIVVNKDVPKSVGRKYDNQDRNFAVRRLGSLQDHNKALAYERKRINDRLEEHEPLSIKTRSDYHEKLNNSVRKAKENLETMKFLQDKYDIEPGEDYKSTVRKNFKNE